MSSPATKERFNRKVLCPVCESGKNCSRTDDGLYRCRAEGPADPSAWRCVSDKGTGWRCYRRADEPKPERNGFHGKNDIPAETANWRTEAESYAANMTPEHSATLAASLGLPVEMLDVYPLVGVRSVKRDGATFSFPEFSGRGRCVGISLRLPSGKKIFVEGGSRGLSVPANFRQSAGSIYIVEGPSDTIAVAGLGIACVGRFSDKGGAEYLADLLADVPKSRGIVIIAENDEHEDRAGNPIWPGRAGAKHVAAELSKRLSRPVRVAFPPSDCKDAREFVKSLLADGGEEFDPAAVREQFVAGLKFDPEPEPEPEESTRGRDWSKLFITSDVFAARDTRANWLVKQAIVWDQPCVVGGPQKVLKTSFLVDLVLSLASGTPFLGRFETFGKTKCAMLSGESGDDTLKRTAERVGAAKGFHFGDVKDNVIWCFEVPALADPDDLGSLCDYLARQGAKVAVVDPLYLALLTGGKGDGPDARSLYEMGATFRSVATHFKAAGITPILAHHANRRGEPTKPMELSDLAFSGISEFSRQWLLLSRRKKYEGNGRHELWVTIGGSAGQSGLYVADINEGTMNDDFSGRTWEVDVQTAAEARSDSEGESETRKANAKQELEMKDDREVLTAIDAEKNATVSAIRVRVPRLTTAKIGFSVNRLLNMGIIEPVEFEKGGGRMNKAVQTVQGYRRVKQADDS